MSPTAPAGDRAAVRRDLLLQLVRRDILGRYRGSLLGIAWALVTPLLLLAVYGFVFGGIFRVRWSADPAAGGVVAFALPLFAGLIVFGIFADVMTRAPGAVLAHPSFVRKMVFPLEVLPVVTLGSALFHAVMGFAVLLVAMLAFGVTPAWTALFLPLVLLPPLLLALGIAWALAALGVYVRDITQIVGTLATALLFLSPVFFPLSALPEGVRPFVALNPLTLPVEQVRDVLFWGRMPDWAALAVYTLAAAFVAWAGYAWFQATRKGFADVL